MVDINNILLVLRQNSFYNFGASDLCIPGLLAIIILSHEKCPRFVLGPCSH